MPETRAEASAQAQAVEIEQLRQQIAQLTSIITCTGSAYKVPEPINLLPEYSGNGNELGAWLNEVDDLYAEFVVKGEGDQPDTFSDYYFKAIRRKVTGRARSLLCTNGGNPKTIPQLKNAMLRLFGDSKDLTTNLNSLFHFKKGEKSIQKHYNEMKELNSKLRSNLQLHPLSTEELIDLITVTKYLDGISEPLASIIRNSKPATLEDAYQAVVVNQNAEARKPTRPKFQPKSSWSAGKTGGESSKDAPDKKPDTKPAFGKFKKPFSRPRGEVNNNEEVEENDDEEEDEESATSSEECELNLNFQRAQVIRKKT